MIKTKEKPATQAAETATAKGVYAKLNKAYRVGCPIVSLTTSDPAEATRNVIGALDKCGVITWDCAVGAKIPLAGGNADQPRKADAEKAIGCIEADLLGLADFLVGCQKLPRDTAIVVYNAHRFIDEPSVVQAIWNLRDPFKSPKRMLILMSPALRVPIELQHDVIELDEPLPNKAELANVITRVAGHISSVSTEQIDDAANASQGLSAFAAEQMTALNLSKDDGLSVRGVWGDKCAKISETPGLKVISCGGFDSVAGVEQVKKFLKAILGGRDRANCIVYVDEIEKSMGGSAHDTSGVSQDQLGVLLQYMQDNGATGAIFNGPPGAAKSAIAKAAGAYAGIPTIQIDLGAMKGSLVGESETRIRDALKVIDSVSGGKTLWLATCNSLTALPPELRRRFKFGTWFFDLPTLEERKAIWALYCKKYELDAPSEKLLDQPWTGAEIESCCDIAWRTMQTVEQAADFIVSYAVANARALDALRDGAEGKFLSASAAGYYTKPKADQDQATGSNSRDLDI